MHCTHPLSAGSNGPKAIGRAQYFNTQEDTSTAQSTGRSGTAPLFLVVTTILSLTYLHK